MGVGPSGELSSDPAAILAGAQLPFGRHKGANLAAMIELLSAALSCDYARIGELVAAHGAAS